MDPETGRLFLPQSKHTRPKLSFPGLAQGVICWLTLALVCGSALVLGGNRPPGWLLIFAGAMALLILQMLLDLSSKAAVRDFRRLWPAILLWLGVVLWALVQAGPAPIKAWAHPSWADAGIMSGSISADPEATYHGALRLLSYAALFWIAVASARNAGRALTMLQVLALWSVVLAMFGIIGFLADWNPFLEEGVKPSGVTASFRGPNAYAVYAGMGLLCCLCLILLDLTQRIQGQMSAKTFARDLMESMFHGAWILWFGLAIIAAAAFYTASRAGFLSAMAGFLVLITCAFGAGQGRLRLVLALAFALPIGIVMLGANRLGKDLIETDLKDALRPEIYAQTIEAISASPWLGYGLGSYREAFRAFMSPDVSRLEFDFAHNSYLENAFELGIPAAMALYLAVGWIAVQIWWGVAIRRRWRAVPAMGIAVLAMGSLHALVDFSLQMPAGAALAAILLGISWGQSTRENASSRSRKRRKCQTANDQSE